MATSFTKFQYALNICEEHDKKELHAYCKTCQKKICTTCIKEEHSIHDWETITEILREKKYSLPKECKEIRANQLQGLKKEIYRFDRKIKDEDNRFELNKSNLNCSRKRYISGINKLFDAKIDECQQKSNAAKEVYIEKLEGLKQKVEYLDMMTTALDQDINTLPDHDILDMEKEMRNELEKALTYSADEYNCTTVFIPGELDKQTLENMIGEIHSVSVEEKIGSIVYSDDIMSIKPVSETNAWIRVWGSRVFELIDITGKRVKEMKTPADDLVIFESGDVVLTDKEKCSVSVFTEDENQKSTFETNQLYPTYINKTENDDVLISMWDDGDPYNLVSTSRRIVQRMTLTGKVLHTYEFREDGKTRLFTCPVRTAENKNRDVCVINELSDVSGELVVLHKDGRVKFTYTGDGLQFFPTDVECDDKCHILLTDHYSRAIHILTSNGKYLCRLCQYEDLNPFVISLYDNNMWCGFSQGRVKIYRHKS
ncbi:hypothetical protein FSP39_015893 [Pinctada imbricata]|uniref:B box-type domain-containing protein n=1 Tax=Pinctada imbricata TaxID=66713 RepID=A0AA88YDF5_PINIB|nr:hypothetical protein FSP39_015893 [Pinctada imbricata]